MAIPRVFVSSTCYDLKYIRESLNYFIKTLGYDSVLSDQGDVYYNVGSHTHESCIDEVSTCQLFVLIIGGRYGGKYVHSENSITNEEYKAAIRSHIPVFTLVESGVYKDHNTYQVNSKNKNVDRDKITYPSVDNIKIFSFIDEVRRHSINNALQPFDNFADIESYLKKQWAGMLFDFLLRSKYDSQGKITEKLLSDLSIASKKTEELVEYLIKQANTDNAQEIIDYADLKSKAERFPELVLETFGIIGLRNISVEKLNSFDDSMSWDDYLLNTGCFRMEQYEGQLKDGYSYDADIICIDRSFVSLKTDGVGGVQIGSVVDGVYEAYKFPDIEESYEALKQLRPEDRKKIASRLNIKNQISKPPNSINSLFD